MSQNIIRSKALTKESADLEEDPRKQYMFSSTIPSQWSKHGLYVRDERGSERPMLSNEEMQQLSGFELLKSGQLPGPL